MGHLVASAPEGDQATILLVDDEESVRRAFSMALSRSGFSVMEAGSGEEALEVYQNANATIAAVILDAKMPGMGGSECLRELLGIDPDAKVVVVSGHLGDSSTRVGINRAKAVLEKPVGPMDLVGVVRSVLEDDL